jgi:hypothetical protein
MLYTKKNQLSVRLLAIAAIVLSPVAAHAATAGDISAAQVLNTSPVWSDAQSYPTCNVVNISTATITVTIAVIDQNGNVLNSDTIASMPGVTYSIEAFSTSNPYTGYARCRFTTNYASTNIRGNLATMHSVSGGAFQIYALSEAR